MFERFLSRSSPLHSWLNIFFHQRDRGKKWRFLSVLLGVLSLFLLSGCFTQTLQHGQVLPQEALQDIQVGSSEEQVLLLLGTPSTVGSVDGKAYYYISQTVERVAFFSPKIVDQRVIAVYFDKNRRVQSLAEYGLKDGKIFDFNKNKTPTIGRDFGLINQILSGAQTPSLGILK